MSITKMSVVHNTDRKFTVIVDECNGWSFKGLMFHNNVSQGMRYDSLLEMIINMDCILDEMGSPKQTFQMRSFQETGELDFAARLCDETNREGKIATFHIYVEYRNHASWQGIVTWKNGKCTEKFDSGLQLVLLINQILSGHSNDELEVKNLDFCHVAIDAYDAGCIVGNYQNIPMEKVERFYAPADLAKTLGYFMEIGITEEEAQNIRFDYDQLITSVASSAYRKGGRIATFSIKIMFREHATWQGIIFWHEGKMQQPFRSFKEMLFMVASVVGSAAVENGDKNIKKG